MERTTVVWRNNGAHQGRLCESNERRCFESALLQRTADSVINSVLQK